MANDKTSGDSTYKTEVHAHFKSEIIEKPGTNQRSITPSKFLRTTISSEKCKDRSFTQYENISGRTNTIRRTKLPTSRNSSGKIKSKDHAINSSSIKHAKEKLQPRGHRCPAEKFSGKELSTKYKRDNLRSSNVSGTSENSRGKCSHKEYATSAHFKREHSSSYDSESSLEMVSHIDYIRANEDAPAKYERKRAKSSHLSGLPIKSEHSGYGKDASENHVKRELRPPESSRSKELNTQHSHDGNDAHGSYARTKSRTLRSPRSKELSTKLSHVRKDVPSSVRSPKVSTFKELKKEHPQNKKDMPESYVRKKSRSPNSSRPQKMSKRFSHDEADEPGSYTGMKSRSSRL